MTNLIKKKPIIERAPPIDFRCNTCFFIKPLTERYPRRQMCLDCKREYERKLYHLTRAHKNPNGNKRGRPRIHPIKEENPLEPKRGRGRPKKSEK